MKILVDADACPVKEIIEKVAEEYKVHVTMVVDSSHMLFSEYSEVITVGKGKDAVDIALINRTMMNDIVVTQDYGVAAMALGKGAYAINNNGVEFTDDNIDQMLFERHISSKIRRSGGRTCGFHKRTAKNDADFQRNFTRLLKFVLDKIS